GLFCSPESFPARIPRWVLIMTERPPDWFDKRHTAVWNRTRAQLRDLGSLHDADRDTLVGYVRAVVEHEEAAKLVHKTGVLIKARDGNAVRNPAVVVESQSRAAMLRSARALGLVDRDRPPRMSRMGRAERALNEELRDREVGPAERA